MPKAEVGSNDPTRDFAALERAAASRWSCRGFRREPLPVDLIERILRTAQQTASWNNVQPWQLVITRGDGTTRFRELMLRLASGDAAPSPDFPFPREYRDVYLARRRACGYQLYDAVGISRGDKEAYGRQRLRNFEFFDAPHVAIITSDEALGVYGALDCGAYLSTFMLAAQALGVGTIAQAALSVYSDRIRRHFDIPDTRRVVCGISFGWPDLSHPANRYRTARAPLDGVVRWAAD